AGRRRRRAYGVRSVRGGQTITQAETGLVDTSYTPCAPSAPQVAEASVSLASAGACSVIGGEPGSPMTLEVHYSTTGTGPGHTVAVDERIGSGLYAEIASGLPAGSFTLVRQLEGTPRRVYDPSG